MTSLLRRIHHVNLTVPAAEHEAARGFYRDALGLAEIDRPPGITAYWFRLGDGELHVARERGEPSGPSNRHVAFETDDLAGLQARLAVAGAEIIPDADPPGGTPRFFAIDPWGNRLEFIATRAE